MMMKRARRAMPELDDVGSGRFPRGLLLFGLGLATLAFVLLTIGFVAAHLQHGRVLSTTGALILAAFILAAIGCGWLLVRALRTPTSEAPLTRKERLNLNLLIASGVIGALMGAVIMIAGGEGLDHSRVFSSSPLPPAIALIMVLLTGLLVPALSIYWHRAAVDEQEADAYKTGALYAVYVYMIGAPLWWFGWRGGFVPPPDGITLYLVTIGTLGVVWTWKKYR